MSKHRMLEASELDRDSLELPSLES